MAVILDAAVALEQRRGQIADLARRRADQPQRNRRRNPRHLHVEHIHEHGAAGQPRERSAEHAEDCALHRLFRADVRAELVLAQRPAAEIRRAVARISDGKRHRDERNAGHNAVGAVHHHHKHGHRQKAGQQRIHRGCRVRERRLFVQHHAGHRNAHRRHQQQQRIKHAHQAAERPHRRRGDISAPFADGISRLFQRAIGFIHRDKGQRDDDKLREPAPHNQRKDEERHADSRRNQASFHTILLS